MCVNAQSSASCIALRCHGPGRSVFGKRPDDLLAGPPRARKRGDVAIKNAPAVVGEDEPYTEDAEGRGGHGQTDRQTSSPSESWRRG